MTSSTTTTPRDDFEEWARSSGFNDLHHHMLYVDEYICKQTNAAWRGWLAAHEHYMGVTHVFSAANVPEAPDMNGAPEWAVFWAVDFDGLANWFSHKPEPFGGRWCYQSARGRKHEKEAQYKVGRNYWGWDRTLVSVQAQHGLGEVIQ